MKRLTNATPKNTYEKMLNWTYMHNNEVYVRGGGDSPEQPDSKLSDFMQELINTNQLNIHAKAGEELDETLFNYVFSGSEAMESLTALLYMTALSLAATRERLKAIEDVLGERYDLEYLQSVMLMAEKTKRKCV